MAFLTLEEVRNKARSNKVSYAEETVEINLVN